MAESYALLSEGWIKAFEREAQDLLNKAGPETQDTRFCLGEIMRNAPADTPQRAGREVGFELWIGGGKAVVLLGVGRTETLNLLKEGEWEDAVVSARMHVGAERDAFLRRTFEEGRMTIKGDGASVPAFLGSLHDRVASLTR